jgi:hypothetical protein
MLVVIFLPRGIAGLIDDEVRAARARLARFRRASREITPLPERASEEPGG